MNITYHIDDINQIATQVLTYNKTNVFVFNAPMGAGKTTLIKSICKQLGIKDEISSPTFSIVNEYLGKGKKIYHFDLYRIENEEELYQIGIEDYINKNAILLIEWPKLILPLLDDYTTVNISIKDPSTRILSIK